MSSSERRELRILRVYGLMATLLLTWFSVSAFQSQPEKVRFTEIDVERINVIEPDGSYRMVIANRPRSIGPIFKGKPFGYPGGTRPGIIFFNDEGTENGGLTFTGKTDENGRYQSGLHMSFDQYNQDQVMVLNYQDNNDTKRTGITFAERAPIPIIDLVNDMEKIRAMPDGPAKEAAQKKFAEPRNGVPMYAERAYLGRNIQKASVLRLADPNGKPRILIQVDSLGNPSLEFLDANGKVTARLPQ